MELIDCHSGRQEYLAMLVTREEVRLVHDKVVELCNANPDAKYEYAPGHQGLEGQKAGCFYGSGQIGGCPEAGCVIGVALQRSLGLVPARAAELTVRWTDEDGTVRLTSPGVDSLLMRTSWDAWVHDWMDLETQMLIRRLAEIQAKQDLQLTLKEALDAADRHYPMGVKS
jgi:hypothetical protein